MKEGGMREEDAIAFAELDMLERKARCNMDRKEATRKAVSNV